MKKVDPTSIKSLSTVSCLAIYTMLSVVILLGCIITILNFTGIISTHHNSYSLDECICFIFMTIINLCFIYKYSKDHDQKLCKTK